MTIAAATEMRLRAMEPADWAEVAGLIYVSLSYWCEANGRPKCSATPRHSEACVTMPTFLPETA